MPMQFAINTPNFGCFGDARLMAELAHEAEDAGWDGFFVWDHIGGAPTPPYLFILTKVPAGRSRLFPCGTSR